jgi:hypothetical protein
VASVIFLKKDFMNSGGDLRACILVGLNKKKAPQKLIFNQVIKVPDKSLRIDINHYALYMELLT